ncbi:hypothetical protein [Actinoplanes sp. G11-F43]|uniref:hypothetical protein n=1 Tax=Actinoplanes sp. G11-F43 TaxID=3424130 RepID=UPI003D3573AC
MSALLGSLLQSELTQRLSTEGWKLDPVAREPRYSHGVGDVFWQFGLNASGDGPVSFSPALGARHPETSRLYVKFRGLPPEPEVSFGVCSVGQALADLVRWEGRGVAIPHRWRLHEESDVARVAEVMVSDLLGAGLRFLSTLSSAADIFLRLENDQSRYQALNGHLAIIAALLGHQESALSALRSYAAEANRQQDPARSSTWNFISSYVDHFGIGDDLISR